MSTYIKVDPVGGGQYTVDPNNVPSGGYLLNQPFPSDVTVFTYYETDEYSSTIYVIFVDSSGKFTNNPEEGVTCFYVVYGSSTMYYDDVSIITDSSWTRNPNNDTTIQDFTEFASIGRP